MRGDGCSRAVVIDVGTNPARRKLCGDVEFAAARRALAHQAGARWSRPDDGRMLLLNTVTAADGFAEREA